MTQVLGGIDLARRLTATQALPAPRVLRTIAIVASGLAVTIVMAMPWSPVSRYFSFPSSTTDIGTHAKLAEEISTNGIAFPTFLLWHVLVVAVNTRPPRRCLG